MLAETLTNYALLVLFYRIVNKEKTIGGKKFTPLHICKV